MRPSSKSLFLDLDNRYSDSHAVIHSEGDPLIGDHGAVIQVVVRMDGEDKDRPDLVSFARALVTRYNLHSELLATVKAFHNSDFSMLPSFDEINKIIAEAEGQSDENQN